MVLGINISMRKPNSPLRTMDKLLKPYMQEIKNPDSCDDLLNYFADCMDEWWNNLDARNKECPLPRKANLEKI
jgi:hypothetical protein